jgi:hypothetical protein
MCSDRCCRGNQYKADGGSSDKIHFKDPWLLTQVEANPCEKRRAWGNKGAPPCDKAFRTFTMKMQRPGLRINLMGLSAGRIVEPLWRGCALRLKD